MFNTKDSNKRTESCDGCHNDITIHPGTDLDRHGGVTADLCVAHTQSVYLPFWVVRTICKLSHRISTPR